MKAACYGKFDCLKHLIANRANLEATSKVPRQPPLILRPRPPPSPPANPCCPALAAAAHGAAAAPPQNGNTALMLAAQQGRLECLKHLIANRAELEATTKVSAAHSVARNPLQPPRALGHIAALLPRASPPPLTACGAAAALPQAGYTALMLAAQQGRLECFEHLIANGANPEATSKVSAALPAAYRPCTTPTHPRPSLVLCRTPAGEGFLLGLDWDPAVCCSPLQEGKTVLDVAKDKNHTEIIARLENPSPSIAGQGRRRYVIADVLQKLAEEEDAELRLDRSRPTEGLPWEVKDCDGMNPMEHAHGQSDFQRIFANCEKGSLWLFTRDRSRPVSTAVRTLPSSASRCWCTAQTATTR